MSKFVIQSSSNRKESSNRNMRHQNIINENISRYDGLFNLEEDSLSKIDEDKQNFL